MYPKTDSPVKTITVTLTPEQYDLFLTALAAAKQRDLRIADWTGESAADIEARYEIPHESILDDMATAYSQQFTGINMF